MEKNFINLTSENIGTEHLCCIIRSKKPHPGVEAKRKWLCERLSDGHVFKKLDAKGCAFIEYAPLEKAWVPVEGENYLYIYCLWVTGEFKGTGTGKASSIISCCTLRMVSQCIPVISCIALIDILFLRKLLIQFAARFVILVSGYAKGIFSVKLLLHSQQRYL